MHARHWIASTLFALVLSGCGESQWVTREFSDAGLQLKAPANWKWTTPKKGEISGFSPEAEAGAVLTIDSAPIDYTTNQPISPDIGDVGEITARILSKDLGGIPLKRSKISVSGCPANEVLLETQPSITFFKDADGKPQPRLLIKLSYIVIKGTARTVKVTAQVHAVGKKPAGDDGLPKDIVRVLTSLSPLGKSTGLCN